MPPANSFPSSDFDPWAETYDRDVVSQDIFPFAGYRQVLETVVELAAPTAGMTVLDIGTGTGNLAVRFVERGCDVWCTDFSQAMLDKARQKLPAARFMLHELRSEWPPELRRRFDRIVSAYVFHHFEADRKFDLLRDLAVQHLMPEGKLIIADLSFPDVEAMRGFAQSVGDRWEQEPYWLADESVRGLEESGLLVEYRQVSGCAGVYCIETNRNVRSQN